MKVTRIPAPVRQQVIDHLRDAIVEMQFRPGQRLTERELTEMTGVSRPTIREALQQLAAEGLVTTTAGKGWAVASLTLEEAQDLYAVRGLLEGLAGRRFAERASDEQVTELRAVYERMHELDENDDLTGFKDEFYRTLFDGAQSATVTSIITSLHARVTALRTISLATPGRFADTLDEIRLVVEAIEARDADAAERASVEHVRYAARVAFAALRARGDDDDIGAVLSSEGTTPG